MNTVSLVACCSSLLTELLHETLQFRGRVLSGRTRLRFCHYSIQLFKSLALRVLNNFEIGFSMAIFREELPIFPLRIRPAAEICSLCKVQIL